MASSSSASQQNHWNYHVFLSFRGEDTRKTFTSHLYEALKNRGINTFKDDKILEEGSSISLQICKAIEESQFAIIIFSKDYASSGWCLDELVKIIQCKNQFGQTVIPVFYDVDPSVIRCQKEGFAEAFVKHEARFNNEKVQGWRTALTYVADLKGHDIRDRIESECILHIVDQISSKLCKTSLSCLQDVVGLNTHLEKVKSLLEMEINDVRIMGIWGMGGIGKTTIARAIFDTLSYQFEASCFLADIKENKDGMYSLQNIILSELLSKKADYVSNKEDGRHLLSTRLCLKKVLVVLDDIDHRDHLNYLAGELGWFGKGSRIIVTTRDKHLIRKNYVLYEVTPLPHHEAIQLFNQHAFRKEVPDGRFEVLSTMVVNYVKGLPLALIVLGSFLNNRDIDQWRSVVERMKDSCNSEIVEKLKISYDGLQPEEQEIFLDIACFFRGKQKDKVRQILESCGFRANIGLHVLIEKSLLFISKDRIDMHDLVQDMGKYIVNMEKDPGERSRLWRVEDFEEVMINNTGTKAVEAIRIFNPPKLQLSKKAMKNMNNLRILHIRQSKDCYMTCNEDSIKYLSNNLRWFVWNYYPSESLPTNFEPKRLVHLELLNSSLHQLWTGRKHFRYLRKLLLRHSENLVRTPDFTDIRELECLDLSFCSSLEEVHRSLGNCRKLTHLYLTYCDRLKLFPSVNVESLEYLDLEGCSSIEKFPNILGSMKLELVIDIQYSGIKELPSAIIRYQTHITKLDLICLRDLVALPSSISRFQNLVRLDVRGCKKLESLPEEIGDLENLEELNAKYTPISQPPSSILRLNKLKYLGFAKHKSMFLKVLPAFVFPRVNEGLCSLEELDLSYCNLIDGGLPEDIGCLSSLKVLRLKGNKFNHLPQSIAHLCALQFLDLALCKRLKELPELPPNIVAVRAHYHLALENIQNLATKYMKFISLYEEDEQQQQEDRKKKKRKKKIRT